jgi:hypothetical protein
MEIRITQCSVGKFNLLSNEESLSFYCGLYENGKLIEEGKARAQLYYSGEPDEQSEFENLSNLEYIFGRCFFYGSMVISTTDYKANCLLFAKIYQENFAEINSKLVTKRNEKIEKKIAILKEELESEYAIPILSDSINEAIETQIQSARKSISYYERQLADLKEDSKKYQEYMTYIDTHKTKIQELTSHLIEQ